MSLPSGAPFGPYRIVAKLGEGGMGEVYRAHDPALRREVAIKILATRLAAGDDGQARFQREARVLASLNHPHIASVFGLVDEGGVRGLVMELVEGPTLDERLASGALPLREALACAARMAEALEAAHDKGIIHRDLKPGNIKLTRGGGIKVLDFGIAKVLSGGDDQVATATTMERTREGTVVGTAAYMSPEQARGEAVDTRTDIWAFGCVLFEMLAGRRAFDARTSADTLALVLKTDPDWPRLPAGDRALDPPLSGEGSRATPAQHRRCAVRDRGRLGRAGYGPCRAHALDAWHRRRGTCRGYWVRGVHADPEGGEHQRRVVYPPDGAGHALPAGRDALSVRRSAEDFPGREAPRDDHPELGGQVAALAEVARSDDARTSTRSRRRDVSVLVSEQPIAWVLRGRPLQDHGPGQPVGPAAGSREGFHLRRLLEP
jgi:Protein kinase domain